MSKAQAVIGCDRNGNKGQAIMVTFPTIYRKDAKRTIDEVLAYFGGNHIRLVEAAMASERIRHQNASRATIKQNGKEVVEGAGGFLTYED